MILLVIWDGLRPDMVRSDYTPYLHRMAQEGAFCRASHAAFPSATRINAASLSTGCYPRAHGIVDNEMYAPAVDAQKAISCADWRALEGMARSEGARLLSVPTLGELLQQAGRCMVAGGSGSPGTTYLINPTVNGPVVNWAVAWPQVTEDAITARYGGMLAPSSSTSERNRFVLRVLREMLIPAQRPDVVVLWLTEPDHSQHYHGLASPEALAMLRELDAELESLVAYLKDACGAEDLTCILLSDHGFESACGHADPDRELAEAGLKRAPDSNDIVRASNSLWLTGAARERVRDVAHFMAERPWVGSVFVRDDLLAHVPGAMPQSAVYGGHPRAAQVMFSYRASAQPNGEGVPGSVVIPGEGSLVATHGSAGRYALNNTLIAWGHGVKKGLTSNVPCGIVDVAPTVLYLLGIAPPAHMAGRVLHELLDDGPPPQALVVTTSAREAIYRTPNATRHQVAHYSHIAGHAYLDQVTSRDHPASSFCP